MISFCDVCRMISFLNLAELTSMEELVRVFVKKELVSESVIQAVYAVIAARNVPFKQQRSAIILFAMLGKANRTIVEKRLDGLIRVGLGQLGRRDPIVAQYTCQAIQTVAFVSSESEMFRLSNDNILFSHLMEFVKCICFGSEWYCFIVLTMNA